MERKSQVVIRGITYNVTVHGEPSPEAVKEAIEFQAQCLAEKLCSNTGAA